jgi:hypothetical protein
MNNKLADIFFFAIIWPIAKLIDLGHFLAEFKAPRFRTGHVIPPDQMLIMLKRGK